MAKSLFLSPLLFFFFVAEAQWSGNTAVNNAICVTTYTQGSPFTVSDGNGGAIITWVDNRNNSKGGLYAQLIDANGFIQWQYNGVIVCSTSLGIQSYISAVSDGKGGAIIAWSDIRIGETDIYVQRINSQGQVKWLSNGIPVCKAAWEQHYLKAVSDGHGGIIIAWQDDRKGPNGNVDTDIFAQRVDSNGTVKWTNNGVAICKAVEWQYFLDITSDGNGGAIISWQDYRMGTGNADIYVQHINSNGTVKWTTNGIALCSSVFAKGNSAIIPDDKGGAIVSWEDRRNSGQLDIYAQRIDKNGVVKWLANGIPICLMPGTKTRPSLMRDGKGGAIITWDEQGPYVQRVDSNGVPQWMANGMPITAAQYSQPNCSIVSDENGGAVVVWYDFGSLNNADVYAQRIDSNGVVKWANAGTAICTAPNKQEQVSVISDGTGGAILAWQDFRNGADLNVFAQRIDANGILAVHEVTLQELASVQPNPATGIFTINASEKIRYSIYDVLGTEIMQSDNEGRSITLDLSAQPRGVYFIIGISQDKIYYGKLILQ